MFKIPKNIDTAFRQFRLFTILVVSASFLLSAFSVFQAFQMVSRVQSKIYVLSSGKALEALAEERNENIPVEAKDHIAAFHRLFFTLSPDDKGIKSRIGKALYLADASARNAYQDLSEKGFYTGIVSGNVSQEITMDSIAFSTGDYPYPFRCYATQHITRTTSTVTRSLITEGVLRNVARSENNPHGFLIEQWKTVDNRDVKVVNR
ncbi:conjugative transposon protein TraK [Ravibacter arvi]